MKFTMIHYNINVTDLEKSLAFYAEALGLTEARRINGPEGSFIIVYLEDDTHSFQLELTWLRDHEGPYIWETKNSTLLSARMILKRHMPNMKPWAVSIMKIRIWGSTSLPTRTATGWKLCRPA